MPRLRASGSGSKRIRGRRLGRMSDVTLLGLASGVAARDLLLEWLALAALAVSLRFSIFRVLYVFRGAALSGIGAGSAERSQVGAGGRRCPCGRVDDARHDDRFSARHDEIERLPWEPFQRLLPGPHAVPGRRPAPRALRPRPLRKRPAGCQVAVCSGPPATSSPTVRRRPGRTAAARRPLTRRFSLAHVPAGHRPPPTARPRAARRIPSAIREAERRWTGPGHGQGAPTTE